jgi:two-component system chemotaxis response regulator CheY
MPVMNGEEMIEVIRKNPAWADLPLLVVSTEGSQTRIERLESKGAKFIHKPFTPEAVRDVVQELTEVSP